MLPSQSAAIAEARLQSKGESVKLSRWFAARFVCYGEYVRVSSFELLKVIWTSEQYPLAGLVLHFALPGPPPRCTNTNPNKQLGGRCVLRINKREKNCLGNF